MFSLAVRTDLSKKLKEEYTIKLESMSLQEVVKEFISYLEYTEVSSSGRKFHPVSIASSRVLLSEPLSMCLKKLEESSNVD